MPQLRELTTILDTDVDTAVGYISMIGPSRTKQLLAPQLTNFELQVEVPVGSWETTIDDVFERILQMTKERKELLSPLTSLTLALKPPLSKTQLEAIGQNVTHGVAAVESLPSPFDIQ